METEVEPLRITPDADSSSHLRSSLHRSKKDKTDNSRPRIQVNFDTGAATPGEIVDQQASLGIYDKYQETTSQWRQRNFQEAPADIPQNVKTIRIKRFLHSDKIRFTIDHQSKDNAAIQGLLSFSIIRPKNMIKLPKERYCYLMNDCIWICKTKEAEQAINVISLQKVCLTRGHPGLQRYSFQLHDVYGQTVWNLSAHDQTTRTAWMSACVSGIAKSIHAVPVLYTTDVEEASDFSIISNDLVPEQAQQSLPIASDTDSVLKPLEETSIYEALDDVVDSSPQSTGAATNSAPLSSLRHPRGPSLSMAINLAASHGSLQALDLGSNGSTESDIIGRRIKRFASTPLLTSIE